MIIKIKMDNEPYVDETTDAIDNTLSALAPPPK